MKQIISKAEFQNIQERSCLYILLEKPDNAISLNKNLSEKISRITTTLRSIKLEKIFTKVLEELPENPIVCDIDVLFNPAYKVDVLNILIQADKQKNFTLVWPGTYSDNKLIYSEEQFEDFKSYDITHYNITCVE